MKPENKAFLEQYLSNAKENTSIGEHLFATNILLNEIARNTTPDIINVEDKLFNPPELKANI